MNLKALRISLLIAILVLFGVIGFRTAIIPEPDRLDFLFTIAIASAFALFCHADSRVIGKPVVHAFLWLTFFGWPVLVPGYLLWSRGLRGLGLAVLFAVLAVVSALVPFLIADYAFCPI